MCVDIQYKSRFLEVSLAACFLRSGRIESSMKELEKHFFDLQALSTQAERIHTPANRLHGPSTPYMSECRRILLSALCCS